MRLILDCDFRLQISEWHWIVHFRRSAEASWDVPERSVQTEFVEYPGGLIGRLAPPFRRGVITKPAFREANSGFDIEDGTGWVSMALTPGIDPCSGRKE